MADRCAEGLAQEATIRVPASAAEEVAANLTIPGETPGQVQARPLGVEQQVALLQLWLGADLPLDALILPRLIAVVRDDSLDMQGLRLCLSSKVPGATFDDHSRWSAPLVEAAGRLRDLCWIALALIVAVLIAAVLAAVGTRAALAAIRRVIRVLRPVGACDAYVARAFTQRLTLRAGLGSAVGAILGMAAAVALLPAAS